MPYESKAIANYFLGLAERDGVPLSPMKIQKLVYFAHGWHLAIYDEPLIDETVEAWEFGPVVPTLYRDFKRFGNGPITEKATKVVLGGGDSWLKRTIRIEVPQLYDSKIQVFLDVIWEKYKGFSAIQLSNLTHVSDSPWSLVYKENVGRKGVDIPDPQIKAYFEASL